MLPPFSLSQIESLYSKFPESYFFDNLALEPSSQLEDVQEEGLRRVISESTRRATANPPILLERAKSNSVSAQLKHANNGFEELEKGISTGENLLIC